MNIRITYFKDVKATAGRIPWWVGKNAFFGFLVLFLVALALSSAVFYRYVFSASQAELQTERTQTQLQEQTLRDLVAIWEEREARFHAAGESQPRNIFVPSEPALKEETE